MANENSQPKAGFGHDKLCEHLANRINKQFVAPKRNIEPSLVIGLFGEWGSGKSYLLNLIAEEYEGYQLQNNQLTVPIAFNPWRFEKEEHLIVPLLKTTELALADCEKWLQTPEQEASKWAWSKVSAARKFIGVSALAFVSSIKTKLSIPGLSGAEAEIDGDKLVQAFKSAYGEKVDDDEAFTELTSHYFNFQQKLKEITGRSTDRDQPKLNLLFLIDDLDRCLPEKAVEMLESIKLFLDVEGCAFVLAVDDEVIERGIVHRYRDYIFQQKAHEATALQNNAAPPITGAEYLEKIVHLPFRLPMPTEKEIRHFLRTEFADLFSTKTPLLDLFVRAVPPVPRKLIRVVELFQLQRDIIQDRGMQDLHELTLARLVILQLMQPEIYRFGRKWQGFLRTMELWEEKHKGLWFLPSMQLPEPEKPEEQFLYEKQHLPLLALIKQHNQSRSGFDIQSVIDLKQPCDTGLSRYFCLLDESPVKQAESEAEMPDAFEGSAIPSEDTRPIMQPSDEKALLDLITSKHSDAWASATGMPGVDGAVFSDDLFEQLQQRIGNNIDDFIQPEWLKIMKPLLVTQQQMQLWGDLPAKLIAELDQEETEPPRRLIIGNCLNALGDTRKGVAVEQNGLPDIDWVKIPAGEFLYGKNKEKQTLGAYRISRFTITNQQFQCFLDADDRKDKQWWNGLQQADFDASNWSQNNCPRTDIDWYQAIAFTRWLSAQLDYEIRLPTEQEWEKAARGSGGRVYPWGDEYKKGYANCNEKKDDSYLEDGSDLKETSSVGMYPQGASPYDVMDMAGNVWEWCVNKYEDPKDCTVDTSGSNRVLRGGSWSFDPDYARSALRYRLNPDYWSYYLGFRVVCSLPSEN